MQRPARRPVASRSTIAVLAGVPKTMPGCSGPSGAAVLDADFRRVRSTRRLHLDLSMTDVIMGALVSRRTGLMQAETSSGGGSP